VTVAAVQLWGTEIGAVSPADDEGVASFEYEPDFAAAGIELSPLRVPATPGRIYRFPGLAKTSWPAKFSPTAPTWPSPSPRPPRSGRCREILRVGTSAGGARPKALIAWNRETEEVRSRQIDMAPGFGTGSSSSTASTTPAATSVAPRGTARIEWAYSEMARAAGIEMTDCRLLEEGDRRHFMARRFDRSADGDKVHMQSLAAIEQRNFELGDAHSYEQSFEVIRRLGLSAEAAEEQFRRMVFNVVGCNQDDHVKNISFLMDRRGNWSLSPTFDVVYSFNPAGRWTRVHQMSIRRGPRGDVRTSLRLNQAR
jgi:hypothetical protein